MRRVHVLRVEAGPEAFAALFAAAAAAGLRLGWLDLDAAPPVPPEIGAVLAAGAERAVFAGEGLTLVARARRGAPRLRDLARGHFSGCTALLVRGVPERPRAAARRAPARSERAPAAAVPPELPPPADPSSEWPLLAAREADAWSVRGGGGDRLLSTAELVSALREPRPFPPCEPLR